ncbi:MAG: DNA polymerase III subunit gamma/tau, partial [Thiomicrorhabdus sp.]|nr:DNA polymerase III subunit gamma/tau [Thiomicrorhabdus sp.]
NALDQQRLHHAYLFTGTRGVGKTTIARIFAKALNCEQGVSSKPCGVCDVCRSIDEGRFIDLIEVDAASRTKVDDTREILDNVQFAPTQGRYKVYLIDEVHMLSKSSFNALLKTLEEPPEHVKFLLATTDPHKLPITVLSRCLQFNLMRLTLPQLQNHLEFVMEQEELSFDKGALGLISKAADGSVRDALSLLDQAIAYGAGEVQFDAVQTMLGWVDQQYSMAILNALASDDAEQLKQTIQQLAVMGVNYQALLAQLIEILHALSYRQVFGDSTALSTLPEESIQTLAENISPERVQLLYQVALLAKQDMLLAPDVRIGFEMALIRMLAFQPAQQGVVAQSPSEQGGGENLPAEKPALNALDGLASARSLMTQKAEKQAEPNRESYSVSQTEQPNVQETTEPYSAQKSSSVEAMPVVSPALKEHANSAISGTSDHLEKIKARLQQSRGKLNAGEKAPLKPASPSASIKVAAPTRSEVVHHSIRNETKEALVSREAEQSSVAKTVLEQNTLAINPVETSAEKSDNIAPWLDLIAQLPLKGMAAEVARNSVLVSLSTTQMQLSIDPEQNYSRQTQALEQFSTVVKQHFGEHFQLEFVSSQQHFTPVKYEKQQAEIRQREAVQAIQQDEYVQNITQTLGMDIVAESIQPI